jgi:hypothetical protein
VYPVLLSLHNWLRWVALALLAWALIRSWFGWLRRRAWTPADRRAGLLLTIGLDLQLLIGVGLAVVSPLIRAALADVGAAMAADELRFFLAEHLPVMLVAVVLGHVASIASRKAPDDTARHRRAALWLSLTALTILVAIPWWRPLLRLLG